MNRKTCFYLVALALVGWAVSTLIQGAGDMARQNQARQIRMMEGGN